MVSRGQLPKFGARAVNACGGDCVTAPLEHNTLLVQGEVDDQAANSDGGGEGGGCDAKREEVYQHKASNRGSGGPSLVILGPPAQETPLYVVVEDVGDGDGGPHIRQVLRSPDSPTE